MMNAKKIVIILAAVLVLAGGYLLGAKLIGDKAYDSFRAAMDRGFSSERWSDQGHSFDLFSKTLVVKGLTVKIEEDFPVEVAEALVTAPLSPEALQDLLGLSDWRGREALKLADEVVLKNLTFQEESEGRGEIAAVTLEGLELMAADEKNLAGAFGFAKSAVLKRLNLSGLIITTLEEDPAANNQISIASVNLTEPSLASPPAAMFAGLQDQEVREELEIVRLLTSLTAKELAVSGVDFQFADGRDQMQFKLADFTEKDISGAGKLGALTISGLDFLLQGHGDKTTFSLDNLEFANLDYSDILNKALTPFLVNDADSGYASYETWENVYRDFNTLGGLFVTPYSLDRAALKNLKITFNEALTVSLAEFSSEGPVEAGKLAPRFVSAIKGLEVKLPADQTAAEAADLEELYEFGRIFGMDTFVVDMEGVALYDEAKGVLVNEMNKIAVKDLFDWTARAQISGLTPERLEVLKRTSIEDLLYDFFNPVEVLGGLALDEFNFKHVDHSLLDRIYTYVGQEEMGGQDKEMAKSLAQAGVTMLSGELAEFLAEPDKVCQAIVDFLGSPGSLEIDLKPQPPLSAVLLEDLRNPDDVLNSMNLTLAVNEAPPLPIVFKIAPGADDFSDDEAWDEDWSEEDWSEEDWDESWDEDAGHEDR